MSPRRLSELERRHRQRVVVGTGVKVTLAWILTFGVYYLLPLTRDATQPLTRLVISVVVFVLFMGGLVYGVAHAEFPELRAVEALGIAIPVFVAIFASIYLSMDKTTPSSFSTPLNHTGALYFTITTLSTVGFGDITPKSDTARVIVSAQMLLDLVLIGAIVQTLFRTARKTLSR